MSDRFRQAFQIALAVVIAHGVSLWLDWDNVKWAGIAIAVCALATGGEALHKGSQRIVGTLVGAAVALIILAFFIQDRWHYILIASLWVGFCTWKHIANPNGYYWVLAAFIVPLLTIMSGAESERAFQTALLRVEQTCLGIITFSLVATFVFPLSTRGAFEHDVSEQTRAMQRIFGDTVTALIGLDEAPDAKPLDPVLNAAAQRQQSLSPRLAAAALESFEVAELRRSWQKMINDLGALNAILGRMRTGMNDVSAENLRGHFIGLRRFGSEIERRLDVVSALLEGKSGELHHEVVEIVIDDPGDASNFDRAVVITMQRRLHEIDELTLDLMEAAAEIRDLRHQARASVRSARDVLRQASSWFPDPEQVAGTVFVMTSFVLFSLVYFYVPSVPVPVLMFAMGTALAVTLASAPFLPLSTMTSAGLIAVGLGCAFHLLIMPPLEGFSGLAAFLFAAAFLICWVWHRPEQGLYRTFALCFLVSIANIDNQQTFSFTASINLGVQLVLTILIFAIALRVPTSFKQEVVFRRLVSRYFASLAALLATVHVDRWEARTWWERQRRAYHQSQIRTIPIRLLPWIKFMPETAVPLADKPKLLAFAKSLSALGTRLDDLLEARDLQYIEQSVTSFLPELRDWRLSLQAVSEGLSEGREDLLLLDGRERLSNRMERIEALMREQMDAYQTGEQEFVRDESLYRMLGALRGVTETYIGAAARGSAIDWPRLREARF
jgi:uncharacterized membrane protein YgaE (UPF0421/DUF939 family)